MTRDYIREALVAASNAENHDRDCGRSLPPCFCFRGKARFALAVLDINQSDDGRELKLMKISALKKMGVRL